VPVYLKSEDSTGDLEETQYTCFFDRYDVADAFDRLNYTVNSPTSTTPFTI
jgi:hypothetical protein